MEEKSKKILKISGIVLGVMVVIFIVSAGIFYSSFSGSKTVTAQLQVEEGLVKVNNENVNGVVELSQGDTIETLEGLATVILYESVIVNLDQNTIITLEDLAKEHPMINQEKGSTWTKFTKLLGVEGYSVKSGNSVASVRGTAFQFKDGMVITAEGEVEFQFNGESYPVSGGNVAEVVEGEVIIRAATNEELGIMVDRFKRGIHSLKELRQLEYNKKSSTFDSLRNKYNISDEEMMEYLKDADKGLYDVDEMLASVPSMLRTETVKKMVELTKQIQQMNKEVEELGGEISPEEESAPVEESEQ